MRHKWSGLWLLLVVPWITNCVSGRLVRLETGEGPPIVYTPPAAEPPPVEIAQEVFLDALTDLLLETPLSIYPRQHGQVVFASWGEPEDTAQQLLLDRCEPSESPDDCLQLPSNAPPPGTLARMRLALSFSVDTLWEGATIPMAEYAGPMAFKVMVYSAMVTYLAILLMPEPFTKGLAAALTVYLVAYIGLGPMWSMIKAGRQFVVDCQQATTPGQLRLAGQRFGLVLGENGMRLFLLLATAAIGGRVSFLAKGPRLPGFRRAALASQSRMGVSLQAVGQVRTVILAQQELVVSLAPTAVAAVAMGPGRGGQKAGDNARRVTEDTVDRTSTVHVDKVVNSNMPHAAERAVERAGFSTVQEARVALQQFGSQLEKSGLPAGTIRDTAHADRIIVPGFGQGGAVVYQVRDGVLKLKTVLQWRP
jgi:hypothetical protein